MMDIVDDGSKSSSVSADIAVPRFQTAQAYGENLTCIGIQELKQGEGNIHTGATPPWLRDDDNDDDDATSSKAVIGPSFEAFKKNAERMKKVSKKNPQRVGANFDRKKKRLVMTGFLHLVEFGIRGPGGNHDTNSEERATERKQKRSRQYYLGLLLNYLSISFLFLFQLGMWSGLGCLYC